MQMIFKANFFLHFKFTLRHQFKFDCDEVQRKPDRK